MVKIGNVFYETTKLKEGIRVKFAEEKQSYIVRASNVAFAVCTKPFNLQKTVLYTIIDWIKNIRGTEDLIFSMGAETDKDCQEMLYRLTQGETQVSRRNKIPLQIEKLLE